MKSLEDFVVNKIYLLCKDFFFLPFFLSSFLPFFLSFFLSFFFFFYVSELFSSSRISIYLTCLVDIANLSHFVYNQNPIQIGYF
jgi:hypothetical protein